MFDPSYERVSHRWREHDKQFMRSLEEMGGRCWFYRPERDAKHRVWPIAITQLRRLCKRGNLKVYSVAVTPWKHEGVMTGTHTLVFVELVHRHHRRDPK